MTADLDPREEVSSIAESLRAHLELWRGSGVTALPRATEELARQRAALDVPATGDVSLPGLSPERRSGPTPASDGPRVVTPAVAPPNVSPLAAVSQVASMSPEERVVRLKALSESVRGCEQCGLHRERKQTVFARGTGSGGLCFVGEGPGADEDEQGYPFVGKAGQLLDKMIEAMGFGRDEVYVCNIVKCRPPKNRKPEPDEMAACRPYLAEQLELVDPKVIVCLGATAVEGLLGIGGGITRLRGNWRLYKGKIPVMPTFHPAYLLRTPEAKRDVWNDLQEVVRHMGRTLPARK